MNTALFIHDEIPCTEEETAGADMLAKLEARRRDPAAPPLRAPAVLTLAGVPVATAGNITTILAQAKSGKTALVGALVGSAVASHAGNIEGDFLTATAGDRPQDAVVLLFDTEQDPCDHHDALERASRRAGVDVMPEWIQAFTLVGSSPDNLRHMLKWKLASLRDSGVPVWFIILDGVADFLHDPNSLEESQAVVTELLDHAAANSCPIISVIHRNEGRMADDTARGHIGKHLARKSAFNLILDKDGDEVTTVYATQNRGAPILKKDGPRFAFNPSEGMHVTVKSGDGDAKKTEEMRGWAKEVFEGKAQLRYSEIHKALMASRVKGKTWAENTIKAMESADVLRKAGAGNYILT